jgi:cytochrome b561
MFVSVREERMGYGATARIVHWVMAVLVILMIAAGLTMTSDVERGLQDVLFIFHKSTGALLLLLVAFRIVWRLTHPAPPLPGIRFRGCSRSLLMQRISGCISS